VATRQIPWARIVAEGVAIVVSILLAFGIQAWWDGRQDRELERRLLEGIFADLARDIGDIGAAMDAALGRAAGADELLSLIGDPLAGVIEPKPPGALYPADGVPRVWLEEARKRHPAGSVGPREALYMVTSTGSIHRVGISNATFSEAIASGTLDVIQSDDLRALITNYYFRASQFSPADDRADRQWANLGRALADGGIAITGDTADDDVLSVLRSDEHLVAEVKNARAVALFQLLAHSVVLASAEDVISAIETWAGS